MKNQESKEIELDVVSLFKTLWRRKFSIIITALLFAIGALGYSAFVAKRSTKVPAVSTWSAVRTKKTMP